MSQEAEKEKFALIIRELEKEIVNVTKLLGEIKGQQEKMIEEEDILKAYQIADTDDAGTIKYYGFVKKNGDWLIQREDSVNKTYRWAKGDELYKKTEEEKGYKNAWINRATLTYFYFYEVF